jgi:hypothetical protein
LVNALKEMEGRPWAEFGKTAKPITQNKLAVMLKPLAIAPKQIKFGDDNRRGYEFGSFKDAFERYLAPEGVSKPLHRYQCDEMGTSEPSQSATTDSPVAPWKCEKSNNDGLSSTVAVQKGEKAESETISPREPVDDGLEIPACLRRALPVCEQCGSSSPPLNHYANGSGPPALLHPECRTYRIRTKDDGVTRW